MTHTFDARNGTIGSLHDESPVPHPWIAHDCRVAPVRVDDKELTARLVFQRNRTLLLKVSSSRVAGGNGRPRRRRAAHACDKRRKSTSWHKYRDARALRRLLIARPGLSQPDLRFPDVPDRSDRRASLNNWHSDAPRLARGRRGGAGDGSKRPRSTLSKDASARRTSELE